MFLGCIGSLRRVEMIYFFLYMGFKLGLLGIFIVWVTDWRRVGF